MSNSYTLGVHFEKFINAQVESGRYATASEVIRAGLRLLEFQKSVEQIHLEYLKKLLAEGKSSEVMSSILSSHP